MQKLQRENCGNEPNKFRRATVTNLDITNGKLIFHKIIYCKSQVFVFCPFTKVIDILDRKRCLDETVQIVMMNTSHRLTALSHCFKNGWSCVMHLSKFQKTVSPLYKSSHKLLVICPYNNIVKINMANFKLLLQCTHKKNYYAKFNIWTPII